MRNIIKRIKSWIFKPKIKVEVLNKKDIESIEARKRLEEHTKHFYGKVEK